MILTHDELSGPPSALRDVVLLQLDSDTIAFSETAQLLLNLNPAAALVVQELQRGAGVSEVAQLLSSVGHAAPEQAKHWVEATLDALTSHGLLANGSPSAAVTASGLDETAYVRPYSPFQPAAEQHYRLLETCALIRFGSVRQRRWVDSVIGHLATKEAGAPKVVIDIRAELLENNATRSDVYRDGAPVSCALRLSWLAPIVKATLWQAALNAHDFLFYIHAGVVGTGTACVLLPAAAGSGKSSLTAALVHRGFRYFSDEVALINPATFHVSPMPLAMATKNTGWEVMARYYPQIESLPVHVRNDAKMLRYLPPPASALKEVAAPVSHIIFPRYQEGAPTRLQPVPRAEALGRLMSECLGLRYRLDRDRVRELVRWIGGIGCFQLTFSCLEAAADLICDVTAHPSRTC